MKVLCFDLSASSGRLILVNYDGGKVASEEMYRFPNHPYEKQGHLYWNMDAIVSGLKEGLKRSFAKHPDIESVGIDTFGVDYVRLGKGSLLLSDPFAYRDSRCQKAMDKLLKEVPFARIYEESGIQKLPFNTIFQFKDDHDEHREYEEVLFLPDYINYLLTGKKATEATIASTGSILGTNHEFSPFLLGLSGLKEGALPSLMQPGTVLGNVRKELCDELGIPGVKVILTASHDTASAIASIDLDDDTCYLSSGTWSLLGCERKEIIANKKALDANFTNELGFQKTNRFLKNIMGLFIIQELYNAWKETDPSLTFSRLAEEATNAEPKPIFIDVDDPIFSTPMDMEKKFYQYLKATNQEASNLARGEIARIVYESMSFAYKKHYGALCEILGKSFPRLVVVGGGSKAELLNHFIADALNIRVETGQGEATVYGNAAVQLLALDPSTSWKTLRNAMIPEERKTYYPKNNAEPRYLQYLDIVSRRK